MSEDTAASLSAVSLLEENRQIALQALALTVQPWNELSTGNDPASSASTDMAVCIERIAALLHVRLVAVYQQQQQQQQQQQRDDTTRKPQKDFSTSRICRQILMPDQEPWWPSPEIQQAVTQQLTQFVTFILQKYNNTLPFHNFQHAYHVVISANKLVDLMLAMDSNDFLDDDRLPASFGLRQDPIAILAVLVAALVHDVDHTGVSNRQLAQEEHLLALQYNDHSINEHQSLHVAFQELLRDDYAVLRKYMFDEPADYRRFRSIVIETVLATDIASPEKSQISKSKWKEAFQQPQAPQVPARRLSMTSHHRMARRSSSSVVNRRGSTDSMMSDVTMDDHLHNNHAGSRYASRRSSSSLQQQSQQQSQQQQQQGRKFSLNSAGDSTADSIADSLVHSPRARRRPLQQQQQQQQQLTPASMADMLSDLDISDAMSSDYAADSIHRQTGSAAGVAKRNHRASPSSCNLAIEASKADMYVKETPGPTYNKDSNDEIISSPQRRQQQQQRQRRHSTQSFSTYSSTESFAGDSVRLAQQRQQQQPGPTAISRRRAALEAARDNLRRAFPYVGIDSYDDVDNDDSSLSLTPPSSEDEADAVPVRGVVAITNHAIMNSDCGVGIGQQPMISPSRSVPRVSRRASTGNIPVRFGPLTAGHRIDEEEVNNGGSMHRLLTSKSLDETSRGNESGSAVKPHRPKRLGIRRSIDFSGESINVYSTVSKGTDGSLDLNTNSAEGSVLDEPDDLRAVIVLELILRAADVGHLMQNWENMTKFSSRLFRELEIAHNAGRGPNLGEGWFDNQARALEHYVLPLALQLDETGVFGEFNGALFAQCAENNRDQWQTKGIDLTEKLCQ